MQRTWSADVPQHVGRRVRVAGWLHNRRQVGKIAFVLIRDRYGIIQVTTESAEALAPLEGMGVETVVEVEGDAVAQAQATMGVEIHNPTIRVISSVTEALPFPINKPVIKAHLDTFLDHAVVGLRHPDKQALFRLSAGFVAAFREALSNQGFVEIQTPKIISTFSEGGANLFAVQYFDGQAYLAQSPQLYKQIMVGVFERVFEVGPVFRAEPHTTARHLNEYVSLDVEVGFIEDHTTVMALLADLLRSMSNTVRERCAGELQRLKVSLPEVPASVPTLTFAEAQQLIFERNNTDVRGEADLSPQDERWLGEWAREVHGSDFVFVTGFPSSKRPFYTHHEPSDLAVSRGFDLLFRGMELVTGGQRLHRYEDYLSALAQRGLDASMFEGYLTAFKFGMPPHGGFAIGLERLLMQLLDLPNIRLATLFPRDMKRTKP